MVRNWNKKVMAVILAGSMVMGMAGCGQKDTADTDVKDSSVQTASESKSEESSAAEESKPELASYVNMDSYFPICADPINITITGEDGNKGGDWNETDLVQYIGEQMGIKMDATPFASDAWPTQFTLLLSSDELPDMIINTKTDINVINKNGQEGYFLPINEYLDYMPNFKAFLEEHPDYASVITASDGNIYGLVQYNENRIGRLRRTFINKTWLDNVGMEYPTNVDELYDVLKAFKEQDANGNGDPGDEIPMSSGYDMLVPILHAYGIMSNDMKYSPVVDESSKVTFGQASENYKEMLKFMKKLYDEGLYDKDGLVQTGDEFNAKFLEGRIGMFGTWGAPYVSAKEEISYDANWLWIDGLTSDYNDVPAAVYNNAAGTVVKLAVSANTEYPEAICRLIDWLFTDEGSLAASRGIEGVGMEWTTVDYLDNVKISQAINPDANGYTSAEEYRYKKGVINEGFNVRALYYSTMYQVISDLDDTQLAKEELLTNQGWICLMERGRRQLTGVDVFPTLVYTDEEASTRSTLQTAVKEYVKTAFGQFVIGELDIDKDWDTYLKNLEGAGLSELMAIEQAAYDRSK